MGMWPPYMTALPPWFAAMQEGYDAFGGCGYSPKDMAEAGQQGAAGQGARQSPTYARRKRRQKAKDLAHQGGDISMEAAAAASANSSAPLSWRRTAGRARKVGGFEPRSEEDEFLATMTKEVEDGGEGAAAAIEFLRGNMPRHSFGQVGCRLVQAVLQHASSSVVAELVEELHGHVADLVSSPHGNYVLQRTIEVMPAALSSFVAAELLGRGVVVARHRFGCRIFCRLLEHAASSPATCELMDEVLAEAMELSRHSYAHHVISAVLEHGLADQQQKVLACLNEDLLRHAQNRNASYVIEKAMSHSSDADRDGLSSMLADSPELIALAKHQFGSFVIRALLVRPCDARQRAITRLLEAKDELQAGKFGQRVLEDMGHLGTGMPTQAS